MPRGRRAASENAVSVVKATTAAQEAISNNPQVQHLLDRLTPIEMDGLFKTLMLKNRKQTKDEALVVASLLETQLNVIGLRGLAADVASIQVRLREFEIK
jgi:hypothetical protein